MFVQRRWRLDVLIFSTNFSLRLFLDCSYFSSIFQPSCSYKVCSYNEKKTCTHTTLRAETFAGRNFRVTKKTRNILQKLSRMTVFGTNFAEKTFAKRKKSSFSREKTFANGKIQEFFFYLIM